MAIHHVAKVAYGVRHENGRQGVLHWPRVDNTDHVPCAGRLEDCEKGAGEAVLRVQLDDLPIIVGTLEDLDARVERPPVRGEEGLHRGHHRVEGIGAQRATLDGLRRTGGAFFRRAIHILDQDGGGEGELKLAGVADRDATWDGAGLRVRVVAEAWPHADRRIGRCEHGAERVAVAVLQLYRHLAWNVAVSLP
eukprot:7380267-Prymnesium_polylepis.1